MRPPDMYDPGGSSHANELQPEVLLYTASPSASRRRGRTSADRYALCALLRGYGLAVDVRDVSRSKAHRSDLKSLLAARGCAFSLPQLLVGGRLVGGPDDVRQLHQAGGLRPLLNAAPRPSRAFVCQACKRVGSEPCPKCRESRNKMLDHGITEEAEERVVLFYPTQDVSIGGRGREMDASSSVSLGAMRPLLKKLDMMLGPNGCKLTKGGNDMSHLLKDDLEEIGACLEDLLEVEDPPLAAKCWMKEARELSYDIQDCIDNFVPPESLGNKSDHKMTHVKIPKRLKWQKQIGYAAPDVSGHVISKSIRVDVIRAPRKLKWYQQMVEKVSEFRIYAREVMRRYERYQLHCCSTSATHRFSAIGPIMPMPPLPCEKTCSGLVIDGRMSKFINSLANDADQQLKVVSIHGFGCLGKTMLAKVLFNKIGRKFHCRAFVRVSKKPDMKRLFRDMLSQFQRKQPQASQDASDELRITAENISNCLHGKRYLVVVDDLWDTSAWDVINQLFPKCSQGSRIITTTQIEDVALACCCDDPEQVFEMNPLDDDHSRKLFFGRIFGSESDCPEELKQVSSQIVEICGGLPLATISIASLLANQPSVSVDLLTHIQDSLVSCLSSNSTSERTRQVLNLSYNSLPLYLKTCLLHLSMYLEGSIILKQELVRQWVAEGFLAASEGQNMEEVAGIYFDELVDRRFIQPVSINFNNEVVSCTVHAMVHDLIAHKSAEENFIVVVDHNRKNLALSHKVRRLSLQLGDAKYAKIPANIRKSQVRSLGFFGLSECMPCIGEFKLVRVLNLQLSSHRHGNQDQSIDLSRVSELFHLRYLKIVCDVCIKLPNRMRGLQCLETLDVMDTPRGTYVPWDMIYLPRLLHLSLPPDTNLLDWSVGDDLSLCKPNHLQDLCISTPPSSDSDHLKRSMCALDYLMYEHDNLRTVKVVSYGDASKARFLWVLDRAAHLLERFEVSRHSPVIFCEMYRWKKQLGNLCILKITVDGLSVNDVDILRGLPALTALSLYVETSPNMKIIFGTAAGFTALKYLKLRFMSGIAWLKFEAGAMPNLWKLRLVFSSIPRMDQRLVIYSDCDKILKQYRHGTALISIEHMPRLREVSAKFGGAAADLQFVSRIGVVSNHPSNPIIDVQLVDSGSHGDKRISARSPESTSCPMDVPLPGGGEVSWSNMIGVIGRDLFIYCLHRLSRWEYGAIASLNRDFNSVVRNGDIYRLRRNNGVTEHWLYLSCGNYPPEWEAYDPSTGRWIQVPNMPPPESKFIWESLAVGTELLVFGSERAALRYSILTNSWTWLADEMNTPRYWFGSASVGEKAYVVGGVDSSPNVSSSAEMYDSETHTLTPLPSMNRARHGCSGAFMDGRFYVIGGNSSSRELLTCGEEYDLNRRSWRVIDNMSQGLNETSQGAPPRIAVVNNELYAADYSENNDLKQYDKLENKWITLGKLPVQSKNKNGWDMGFRACGDRLIVIGRPNNSSAEKVVELHSWTPDGQPPVWNLFATRPYRDHQILCAVMAC
ncbi:disease resistance protein RGA5-like [Triticum dicoccoides]|uniref:disease resistance protein RGA5-like n=1 Tax=Triticum dicoccoides TaxID=85692 RepID=UPI0018919958|nr:disease resistance protein RGA5-like [Triticum dicoccoides]XP_037462837.1 disease resistance protein RGA5-like [Triticum dicoccoides]